jgi:hypothetical protein
MTESSPAGQVSGTPVPVRRNRDEAQSTLALITLCGLFAVLDVAGIIYVMVKHADQQLMIWIVFGGLSVLAVFVVLMFYIATNPITPRRNR